MKYEIKEKAGFKIVGMKYYGNNSNNEIFTLWDEFKARLELITNRINVETAYGYDSWTKEINKTGCFTYVAAVEVADDTILPDNMVFVEIPDNKYAVFELDAENMSDSTIQEIYKKWLPHYDLKMNGDYDFEFWDKDNRLFFHIPIK